MTQTKKQGRLRRRLYALTAALALVVSLFSGIPGRKVAEAAGELTIVNADFSNDPWLDGAGWESSFNKWKNDENADAATIKSQNGDYNFWSSINGNYATFTQTIAAKPGHYLFTLNANGDGAKVKVSLGENSGDDVTLTQEGIKAYLDCTITESTNLDLVIRVEITSDNGWGYLKNISYVNVDNLLVNGDFETGNANGWTITIPNADGNKLGSKVTSNTYMTNNTTNYFNVWNNFSDAESLAFGQLVVLEKGTYELSFKQEGVEGAASGLSIVVNGKKLQTLDKTSGFNAWSDVTQKFSIDADAEKDIFVQISGNINSGYWGDFDNFVLKKVEDDADAPNVDKTTYSIVSGDNESLNIDTETDDLEFEISCAKSVLSSVLVDKEALGKDDFTVSDYKNGNDTITKVTLKNSFLKSLDAEKHTIAFEFSDAEAIEGSFEITALPTGIVNGYFEDETLYWQGEIGWKSGNGDKTFSVLKDGDDKNDSNYLCVWFNDETEQSIYQTFKAENAGRYYLSYDLIGGDSYGNTGVAFYINGNKVGDITTKKWDLGWQDCETDVFDLKEGDVVTLTIKGKSSMWFGLDDIKLEEYIDTTVEGDLTIKKVKGLEDNIEYFANGVDISAIHSIYASGGYCKDFEGNKLSEAKFFEFLAENGVNYVRIRVWNNPYDADGNGYGGGNNDLAAAKIMGQYASEAGMKVLIDFHFSDFWADPSKQQAPKAWAGKTVDQKAAAISEFVTSSLNELLGAGVSVGMVQIGNETNGSFCGETKWDNMNKLFAAGCDAVHEVAENNGEFIYAVLHFTDPQSDKKQAGYAENLSKYNNGEGVDYDVFATSYYPYWHGSLDNLKSVLTYIAKTYDKDVMVAETSYAWTLEDGDGHENTVRKGNNDEVDNCIYPYTVAGQAAWVRDVVDTVNSIDTDKGYCGIGVFYWEAAWIPVNYYDPEAADAEKVLAANKAAWEKYGSGWASSYAADYDPDDAGKWYGGSAIDNQAFFGFDGTALDSLKVYKYMLTGSVAPKKYDSADNVKVTVEYGDLASFEMPGKTTIWFNDMSTSEADVVWDKDQLATALKEAKASGHGEYEVVGTVTYGKETKNIIGTIIVVPDNLLVNGSFENGEEGWTITRSNEGDNVKDKSDTEKGSPSPHDGTKSFHFWSDTAQSFEVSQNVTLEPGVYTFTGYFQGFSGVYGSLFYKTENKTHTIGYALNGWENWQNPSIDRIIITEKTDVTVGFTCKYNAGDWGTCDDFYLFKEADVFTVTFDNNGHGKAPEAAFVVEGETVDEPKDLETEGYTFTGWYTDKTCTQRFSFSKYITSDITLYAGWTKNPDKSYYQDGKAEGSIGSLSWTPGDGDLHGTYHSTVNDAETIIHFKDVDIARYLNDAVMVAGNGFEAAADAVARGLAPSSAGFTPFAALGLSSLRAESGSLKLTIFSSYLETLEPGYYLLRIVFDDGEVYTMLTINAKAADAEVEPDDNKAADAEVEPDDNKAADADVEPADDSASNDTAPKTGDDTPVSAVMLILLISAAGLSYMLGLKREKRR